MIEETRTLNSILMRANDNNKQLSRLHVVLMEILGALLGPTPECSEGEGPQKPEQPAGSLWLLSRNINSGGDKISACLSAANDLRNAIGASPDDKCCGGTVRGDSFGALTTGGR